MTGPVFVDTNVLVYRFDATDQLKQLRADSWLRLLAADRSGRLSFQVLQEFYVTLTKKLKAGFAPEEVREIVRDLIAWQPVTIDLAVLENAWALQERYSLSWWDALIVGAAQVSNCPVLLTEDLQHGQRVGTVRVIDPFAAPERAPAEVLASLAD